MTRPDTAEWEPLAAALADDVTPRGSPWRDIVARTPRHVFVPEFAERDGNTYRRVSSSEPTWLERVYTDEALTTQHQAHPDHPGLELPTSSTTRPSLMIAMLDALDVTDGARVLELGTGTGYNAALLCERLGQENITSVDLDPGLVEAARRRLASAGYRPHLDVADSAHGYPARAPYDRVIATHSVERIPHAWVAQTRPGGRIVCDVRSAPAADIGRLATLTVDGDGTARGRFWASDPGGFMAARTRVDVPSVCFGPPVRDLRDAERRRSRVDPTVLTDANFRFALWARSPHLTIALGPDAGVSERDGAWAQPVDARDVDVAGPVDLWEQVEEAHAWWVRSGSLGPADFGITVTPEGQRVRVRRPLPP
ncbi:methyltransferase domain-containing protein [Nocardiopsis sp. NPDC049922]|uniref:methyltransferase domain-containing protein n=1 Tax=Nocardiopsis sp. NPDC049922 TaxID=3155157 RepID=UPI0033FC1F82